MLCECIITIIFTRKCRNCDALEFDAALVVLRFNYGAHNKVHVQVTVHQPYTCLIAFYR